MNLLAGDLFFFDLGPLFGVGAVRLNELPDPALDVGIDRAAGAGDGHPAGRFVIAHGSDRELVLDDVVLRLLPLPGFGSGQLQLAIGQRHRAIFGGDERGRGEKSGESQQEAAPQAAVRRLHCVGLSCEEARRAEFFAR